MNRRQVTESDPQRNRNSILGVTSVSVEREAGLWLSPERRFRLSATYSALNPAAAELHPGNCLMSMITLFRPEQRALTARIRTSACRGYVVELDPETGGTPRMLESLFGNVVHFPSLDRVQDALRRRGVQHATLTQHHACEELGAGGVSHLQESGVPFPVATRV